MVRRLNAPQSLMALPPLLLPPAVTLASGLPAGQSALAATIGVFPAVLSHWLTGRIRSGSGRLRPAALVGALSTSLFACLVVGSAYYGFVFAPFLVLLFGLLGLLSLRGTWTLARGGRRGALAVCLPLCLVAAVALRVSPGGPAAALLHLVGWACVALAALNCALTLCAPGRRDG
ncbi:hypothetical protein [Streptomyces sp. cg36]|uniref:hypothetical protein n=1 Tax=Streptomyces sp. cg36 TaxID=3238798 RepID=UPI0034E2FE71